MYKSDNEKHGRLFHADHFIIKFIRFYINAE